MFDSLNLLARPRIDAWRQGSLKPLYNSTTKNMHTLHPQNPFVIVCSAIRICVALAILEFALQTADAQQSTSGPFPPPTAGPRAPLSFALKDGQGSGASYTIPGVPAYKWRHGCGPTALGMVMGYYDIGGCGRIKLSLATLNQKLAEIVCVKRSVG